MGTVDSEECAMGAQYFGTYYEVLNSDIKTRQCVTRSGRARLLDEAHEPSGQFRNPAAVPLFDSFPGNELAANAQGNRSRRDEVSGVDLIDTARGDQRNFGKRRVKGADVSGAAHRVARKHLDEIGARLPAPC